MRILNILFFLSITFICLGQKTFEQSGKQVKVDQIIDDSTKIVTVKTFNNEEQAKLFIEKSEKLELKRIKNQINFVDEEIKRLKATRQRLLKSIDGKKNNIR